MKRYIVPLLLLAAAAFLVAAFALYLPRSSWSVGRNWSLAGMSKWAQDNQWHLLLLSVGAALVGTMATIVGVFISVSSNRQQRKQSLQSDAERLARANRSLALEHSYLLELIDWFNESRRDPLSPEEEEILQLKAEISAEPKDKFDAASRARQDLVIEPKYRIDEVSGEGEAASAEARIEHDLVAILLKSDEPVVVLGEPGAGKSASLKKVMLTLAREGLTQSEPRLPVYLRLGHFTQPVTDKSSAAIEFARQSLRELGGHAVKIEENLMQYLDAGRVVFLLDAMDEMPRNDIQNRFDAISRLRRFTSNKLLFACRKLDFPHRFPFLRAYIQPFDRGQQREFLRRTLGELGATAFKDIQSPSYQLRDMAGNPFFLKLLAEFYRAHRRSPDSRAELMKVYEDEVFRRAGNRQTFPDYLHPKALRAVLARLAYLITNSRRGVTIPEKDFIREFVPDVPGEGEMALTAYEDKVAGILDILVRERLVLRSESERRGVVGASSQTLSFHHHRLQEYYTAVYIEEFGAQLDWERGIDDIWWQETLVMLFGITERASERMDVLLRHIPARPLLCPEVGPALGRLLDKQRGGLVGYWERREWPSADETRRELSAADAANFYGLRHLAETGGDEDLLGVLPELGVLVRESPPTEHDVKALLELSPEPDQNLYCERVRRWLEARNAVLLDRLELGVECYRNALSKMAGSETARVARERFVSSLSAFSKDGNMWETVRAIQIASRMPEIDVYAVVEPALISKDAWCRNEAVAAVAKYPLAGSARRRHTGFILFLQFMKGDLRNPVPFFNSVAEIPRLGWLVLGVLLLCVVSWAVAVSPFLPYFALKAYVVPMLSAYKGFLGLEWSTWLSAFGFVIFPSTIYVAKHLWGLPILRTALLVCSFCVFVPMIGQIFREGPKTARPEMSEDARAEHNQRALIQAAPLFAKATIVATGMVVAPWVVELVGLSGLALVSCLLLGSDRILRTPIIYIRNIGEFSTPLETGRQALLILVGLFFGGALLQVLLGLLVAWLRISVNTIILIAICFMSALMVGMFLEVRRNRRQQPERIKLSFMDVLDGLREVLLGERPVRRLMFVLLAVVTCGLLSWGIYVLSAALVKMDYFGYVLISLISSVCLFVALMFTPLRGWLVVNYYTLLGLRALPVAAALAGRDTDVTVFIRVMAEAARQDLPAEERFEIYRDSLSLVRSSFIRRVLYREMHKTYKEMRQKRAVAEASS